MKTFSVPTSATAPEASQPIFAALEKQIGMLPNLYATIGYSPKTLQAYLDFSHAVEHTRFRNREVQAIYLAVSEVNGCSYCLAAHTALAQMNGFSEEETLDLRAATPADPRLRAITQLARAFAETQGRPDERYLDAFFDQGFDEAALVDLVALISVKTFSNFLHNATQIPVDFPAVQPLEDLAVV